LISELVIGSENGQSGEILGRVWDIAVSSKRDIFVLDRSFNHVKQFDSLGVYKQTIGRSGEGPGEFIYAFALAVDLKGQLYVADRNKVVVFHSDGTYAYQFGHDFSDSFIRSMDVDAEGNVFLSCFEVFDQHLIHKFKNDGTFLFSFCDSYAVGQDVDVRIERILAGGALDIDESGSILFTQVNPYEIRKFSREGDLLATIHRNNHFMRPPEVELTESGIRLGRMTGSFSIVTLGNGRFLNVVKNVARSDKSSSDDEEEVEAILDLFGRDGVLLASGRVGNSITPKCSDGEGRIYAVDEDEYPKVVRYRVVVE
jgi:hypothetical protein